VVVLAPKADIDSVYADAAFSVAPHIIFFIFFLPWEAKIATVAKLKGLFCSFFS